MIVVIKYNIFKRKYVQRTEIGSVRAHFALSHLFIRLAWNLWRNQ